MKKIRNVIFIFIIVILLLLPVRFALMGKLRGTFKPHTIPNDYKKLERYLSSQDSFSRSLWIPNFQRFSFFTSSNPAIPAQDYYHVSSISGVLDNLKKDGAERLLQERSVKYVIIPFDSEGELFLKDRKYDEFTYQRTVDAVSQMSWLHEIPGFGRIHVFAVNNPKDHFWTDSNLRLSYRSISPTEYTVRVMNAQKGGQIVFAESYDSGWRAYVNNTVITSQPFEKSLNSFVLPMNGTYTFRVFYQPQEWVNRGVWVSGISLIILIFALVVLYVRKK